MIPIHPPRLAIAVLAIVFPTLVGAGNPTRTSEDGQWPMPGKNYASTRYSGLTQITARNAKALRPVWTFSTGVLAGHEGQPLVVKDTMYVVTPFPNVLYAFDLTHEGYPLRWKYRPEVSPNAIGISCCDVINRGAFYAEGKIVYNLLDGHTVAVDAVTGRELWKTTIADMSEGETTPMAPFVVKDRVIVGASGGEFGIRGWVKGLDLNTGRIVWTAHNIGSDSEILAQPGTFKPHYDKGTDLALASWAEDSWKTGGAPVWGWMSYDPDLDLLYYGAGNPSPYNPEQRAGDNKWTSSVLARRPGDGTLVWAYQFTPHDNWDYDATSTMILADSRSPADAQQGPGQFQQERLPVHARPRDRRGARGRALRAGDLGEAHRPHDRPPGARSDQAHRRLEGKRQERLSQSRGRGKPGVAGRVFAAHGTVLYLHQQHVHGLRGGPDRAHRGDTVHWCGHVRTSPGPAAIWAPSSRGTRQRGRRCGRSRSTYPAWSGALVTAGDVVFYGTLDGWFKAADAKTGKVLWKFKVGSGVVGNPITYRGPDGKQYVAVYAGIGGDWFLLAGDVRSDDPADVRPPADFMKDIARHTSQGGLVWIFAL